MKRINVLYWIFTGLYAAFILMSAVQNLMSTPGSIDIIVKHLAYPAYFVPFIGAAKLLGAIGIVVPGSPRVKEWAYAGLLFDLAGAAYSFAAVGDPVKQWWPMLIFFFVLIGSYVFYHRKRSAAALNNVTSNR